ncbi:MAG: 5-(carboxyamino)imidazole ribonucleotide mutase [Lachnospiraceae bacterium]|nr:5-(carboxyamino)imidazole ribonucleotide mutase [Lachnospiraceae bacterium]
MAKVAIIMGSDSDMGVMKKAADILTELGVPFEINIISAHRDPDKLVKYARDAEERGVKVAIAGAGMAAHLPGVTAGLTSIPVIGVPILATALGGADALYSIVQMPPGIPVATVAINGALNAGLLAAQILATADADLKAKLVEYKKNMREAVAAKDKRLHEVGYQDY